jgi:uncharacterized protein (TIGR02594 family)
VGVIHGSVGRGGINRRIDIITVQTLLNACIGMLTPLRPLRADGRCGDFTIGAIEEFQRRVVGLSHPDGRVDPSGRTLQKLLDVPRPGASAAAPAAASPGTEPPWITAARAEERRGVREIRGQAGNEPRILEYIATVPELATIPVSKGSSTMMSEVDETSWCGCFVNWCLKHAGLPGYPGINAARARRWLDFGAPLVTPRPGAITVMYKQPGASTRGTTSSGFHVAFYTSGSGNSVTLLGGNQGNKVCEVPFRGWTVRGYRWPNG